MERPPKPGWTRMLEGVLLAYIAIFGLLTWVAAVVQQARLF